MLRKKKQTKKNKHSFSFNAMRLTYFREPYLRVLIDEYKYAGWRMLKREDEEEHCWQEVNKEDRGKSKETTQDFTSHPFPEANSIIYAHSGSRFQESETLYKTVNSRVHKNDTRTSRVSGVDFSPTKSVPWNDRSGCWSSGAFTLCSSCVCSNINFTTYHADLLSICF